MVGAIVGLIIAASGQFLGWWTETAPVTVVAPRAGLVMNPDAKVTLRGVEVGRVGSITTNGDSAVLHLNMATDQLAEIPANVTADIKSNTIFGAKAVTLAVPASGPSGSLRPGAVIGADRVVVELNTVYRQLVSVLADVQPDKLNVVIGAVDTALSGNGASIGGALDTLSSVLGKTNPHLPELDELIRQTATTTNVYGDVMNDLMRTVDNATYTGNTLRNNSSELDSLLMNVTGMSNTINGIVAPKKSTLIAALADYDPVSQLFGYQAPGIACFLTSTASAADLAKPLFGGKNGMLLLDASLTTGRQRYRYPQNLPVVGAQGPPTCEGGLSDPTTKEHADFYVTDNAPVPYQPRTTAKADRTRLFTLLFGEAHGG